MPTNFAGRLRPGAGQDPRYLTYLLASLYFAGQTRSAIKQTTGIQNLEVDVLLANHVPRLDAGEQRAIADYLDTETARIDALITKKRRMIELLEERWISFLSEQFDAMDITETRRLLAYCEVVLGRQRSPQHESGPHMKKYLRAANVKAGRLDLDDVKEMNFTPAETGRFMLKPGDVLVTEGSGSRTAVGASAVWLGEIPSPVCFQNTLLRLRARSGVDPAFLGWWAEFAHATELFAEIAGGANIFHLSADRLKDILMRRVELHEQQAAVERLSAFKRALTALVSTVRRQLTLLTEHRQALITAAVTGELEIPVAP